MAPMYLSLVSVHVCSRPRPMLFHYPLAPPHGHPLCLKTLTMWVNSTNPLLSLSSSCSAGASTKPQCWESTAGRNHHLETRSLWRYIHSIQLCIYIWHTLIFLMQRGDIVYVIKDLGNDFCQGVCNNFYCTVPKYILVSHVNVWLYALYGISAYLQASDEADDDYEHMSPVDSSDYEEIVSHSFHCIGYRLLYSWLCIHFHTGSCI